VVRCPRPPAALSLAWAHRHRRHQHRRCRVHAAMGVGGCGKSLCIERWVCGRWVPQPWAAHDCPCCCCLLGWLCPHRPSAAPETAATNQQTATHLDRSSSTVEAAQHVVRQPDAALQVAPLWHQLLLGWIGLGRGRVRGRVRETEKLRGSFSACAGWPQLLELLCQQHARLIKTTAVPLPPSKQTHRPPLQAGGRACRCGALHPLLLLEHAS